MVGTYQTGFHSITVYGQTGASVPVYPDPFEEGSKPTKVDFGSLTAGDSPFAAGDKDAVIRSVFALRDWAGTGTSFIIQNHGGTRRFHSSFPHGTTPEPWADCNILVPGGFRLLISNAPYCTVVYEINPNS